MSEYQHAMENPEIAAEYEKPARQRVHPVGKMEGFNSWTWLRTHVKNRDEFDKFISKKNKKRPRVERVRLIFNTFQIQTGPRVSKMTYLSHPCSMMIRVKRFMKNIEDFSKLITIRIQFCLMLITPGCGLKPVVVSNWVVGYLVLQGGYISKMTRYLLFPYLDLSLLVQV